MIHSFADTMFLKNMEKTLRENEIFELSKDDNIDCASFKEFVSLEGFSSLVFYYLYLCLDQKGYRDSSPNFVYLKTRNKSRFYFFVLERKDNEFILRGQTPYSVKVFLNRYIYGANGIVKGFDKKNRLFTESWGIADRGD